MIQVSQWLPAKSEVVSSGGMVVAKHPLAAEAGIQVLAEGGNAVDAAVAMGFALTVVKPMMTCVAGVGYLLAHDAASGEQWCFDGAPRAPLAAGPESYTVRGENTDGIGLFNVEGDANNTGHRAAAVPGLVAALCTAHERLGRLPRERVLAPAIRLAEEGWRVDQPTSAWVATKMRLLATNPAAAGVFLPGGFPPAYTPEASATVIVQRELGGTLRRIAAEGADGFYRGEVPAMIEADMRAHGGWITAEDLARYPRRVDPPLRLSYRGYEILIPPMPCGATTAAETLRILEHFDVAGAGHNTVEGLHLFIEAARRAYADRFHYLGDPEYVPVPLDGLLSDGHAAALAALIEGERTTLTAAPGSSEPWVRFTGETPAGDPWRFERERSPALAGTHPGGDSEDCTTHLAATDRDGNAVNCTITAAGLFGAGVMTPGAGLIWNNGMTWFNPLPGAANSIAPAKRALTNMSPVMVLRDGRPYVLIGAPGGRKIINAVAQIVGNVLDHGLGMQAAVGAPRVDASANATLADPRLDPAVIEGLRARGHRVQVVADTPGEAHYSRPLGILIDEAGRSHSGLTPFHMAEARGL